MAAARQLITSQFWEYAQFYLRNLRNYTVNSSNFCQNLFHCQKKKNSVQIQSLFILTVLVQSLLISELLIIVNHYPEWITKNGSMNLISLFLSQSLPSESSIHLYVCGACRKRVGFLSVSGVFCCSWLRPLDNRHIHRCWCLRGSLKRERQRGRWP